jgi:hypothetical protein
MHVFIVRTSLYFGAGYIIRWSRWSQVTFGFPFIQKTDYIFSRLQEEKVITLHITKFSTVFIHRTDSFFSRLAEKR